MLVLAGLLATSVFWDKIKDLGSNIITPKPQPKVKPFAPLPSDEDAHEKNSSLVEIIRCWEHLKISCQKEELKEACDELDRIFPLFVPKGKEAVDVQNG